LAIDMFDSRRQARATQEAFFKEQLREMALTIQQQHKKGRLAHRKGAGARQEATGRQTQGALRGRKEGRWSYL
jgi:hypothetical protein